MNKRLLAFLHKRGLAADATDAQAWEFFRSLTGLDASLANALNYPEGDAGCRTNADVMIRALGHNPEEPWNLLPPERSAATATVPAVPATLSANVRGTDGAAGNGQPMDLEAIRHAARLEEARRVADINEFGELAGTPADLIRQLTADPTITVDAARERIRAERAARTRAASLSPDLPNAGPAIHSRNSQTDFNARALSCALIMRAGIDDPTRQTVSFNQESGEITVNSGTPSDELQRAVERGYELRQLPAVVFVQRALALDGIRAECTPGSIAFAIQQRGAAAMSTTSLVNIFTQTFGARLMQGWTEAGDTTEGWVDVEDNPNYLPQERVDIGVNGEGLAHLPRGAEAEDITFGDSNDYTKVGRFARKAVFDDMDLVNDNFGVITNRTPLIMGQIARRLRPDLVYAILLSNPTMADGVALFHASHGNLLAAAGAFSETTLEAAWSAMVTRRINGVNVNVRPTHIIHPATIDILVDRTINPQGQQLVLNSTTDVSTISTPYMSRRGLVHVGDSRLDNGVVDPKTGTTYAGDLNDWYLVSNGPAPIVVSYLAGTRRSPRFRSGVLDRGQFGIWFDVQHNVGAKAVHYETVRKMVNA